MLFKQRVAILLQWVYHQKKNLYSIKTGKNKNETIVQQENRTGQEKLDHVISSVTFALQGKDNMWNLCHKLVVSLVFFIRIRTISEQKRRNSQAKRKKRQQQPKPEASEREDKALTGLLDQQITCDHHARENHHRVVSLYYFFFIQAALLASS